MNSLEDAAVLLDRFVPNGGETLEHEGRGWVGRALFSKEEGEDGPSWSLRSLAVGERGVAALTIILDDAAFEPWANRVWTSLES